MPSDAALALTAAFAVVLLVGKDWGMAASAPAIETTLLGTTAASGASL